MTFENKVVWITGASSGIGEALAYIFTRKKAQVIISARRENELQRVSQSCAAIYAPCYIVPLDLTETDKAPAIVAAVIAKMGRIDILINNGGISQRSLTKNTPLALDRKFMEVNYFGTIALTKAVLPYMLAQKSGHFATISSVTGIFGFHYRSAYAASKHALKGFFETLLIETKCEGIKVTMVYPGLIKTNVTKNALTKDGLAYGKMDEQHAQGMSPAVCAQKIAQAIAANKREVYIGGKEVFLVYLKRYLPNLFYWVANRVK